MKDGKPEIPEKDAAGRPGVNNGNLASRDGDNITKGPSGEEIFNDHGYQYAKAQEAWLQQRKMPVPDLLATRIAATDAAKGGGPKAPAATTPPAPVGQPPTTDPTAVPEPGPGAVQTDPSIGADADVLSPVKKKKKPPEKGIAAENRLVKETLSRWQVLSGILRA